MRKKIDNSKSKILVGIWEPHKFTIRYSKPLVEKANRSKRLVFIFFWKKFDGIERERQRGTAKYGAERIMYIFTTFGILSNS